MKNTVLFLLILTLGVSVFMCERYRGQGERVVVTTDTLREIVRDTITLHEVQYKTRYVLRTDTLEHIVNDTLIVRVPIPMSAYVFTDDTTYCAELTGYNVTLDKMQVYGNTVYERIELEKIIKPREKRWGVGVIAGYGIPTSGGVSQTYIGVGLSYNFIRF